MKIWTKWRRRYFDFFLRPIFWTVLLLLLQVAFVAVAFYRLHSLITYVMVVWYAMQVVLMVYIINRPQNPAYKLAWLVPMCLIPVFGALLYLFLQLMPGRHHVTDAVRKNMAQAEKSLPQNEAAWSALQEMDPGVASLATYLRGVGPYPVYKDNHTTYFSSGEAAFADMKQALLAAEKSIFIEFFIVREGRMLAQLARILEEKVQAGVEVRFLCDGTNAFRMATKTLQILREKGVDCRVFSPVRPVLSTYQNNRDHRKLVIIDGKTGYCGGLNLSDEYINLKVRFGYWKDAAIRVDGSAVASMTAIFLELWHVGDPDEADFAGYIEAARRQGEEGVSRIGREPTGFVLPYADAPLSNHLPGEMVYLHILYNARTAVKIMTPYLVPDNETLQAMCYAAQRGVEVTLLMPSIPDKKLLYYIARSYFPQLIRSGVRVYTFTPGFVHSKVFAADGCIATVGSVNLDYRSLYLHYENGVLVYDRLLTQAVEEDFAASLAQSEAITLAICKEDPLWQRMIGYTLRVFSPLF